MPAASVKMKKAKAIILRGLPGSGKSRIAEDYFQPFSHQYERSQVIFSTDSFFMQNGHYAFDAQKLPEYHARNLAAFIEAMASAVPLVICDNTNICHWEYLAYVTAARAADYEVEIEVVGEPKSARHQQLCYERNQHDVALGAIQAMGRAFEF